MHHVAMCATYQPDHSPLHVMIIEDDAILAWDLALLIEAAGGRVVAKARSAEEALAQAEQTPLDLVVSDVRLLDGGAGIEASACIQARHGARIAFVTAYTDVDTLVRMQRLSPCAILTKPLFDDDVATLMRSLLEGAPRVHRRKMV